MLDDVGISNPQPALGQCGELLGSVPAEGPGHCHHVDDVGISNPQPALGQCGELLGSVPAEGKGLRSVSQTEIEIYRNRTDFSVVSACLSGEYRAKYYTETACTGAVRNGAQPKDVSGGREALRGGPPDLNEL
ncbi:hypothetical protein EVAR_41401_1 [Eumeta japonica]|uniref:Uncharacterized protein n=1 Tax=Eumeta variegata TaxID=151549 RepID=A0A4C1X1H9_EUMVA|nr:hypothetical protein EVAR_41401_1 [Eumeta japonica]